MEVLELNARIDMPGLHALLSPSAAHRWMNCTAAPRLEENIEDKGSSYAEEGTLAHAYCAMKLKKFLGQDISQEVEEINDLNETYHTGEMDEYTDTYYTIVVEKFNEARAKTRDAQLLVETRLDFTKWVPEGFGTGDACIIADGCLEIIDFKYGKGVKVSAIDNPQMKIYALGAYEKFNFEYNINRVKMTIVQPRIDNLSEFEITVGDLLWWANTQLKPKAEEAFAGNGKQNPGEWCQFCKVKAQCKKLAETALKVVQEKANPNLITPEEMATDVLPLIDIIKSWIKGVEDFTLQAALDGTNYPGYKLVAGRSVRKITDQEAVMDLLSKEGFNREIYVKPTELITITDLEKLIGKKHFNELCKDYIEKPQGKPTLVPETDKRPAYDTAADDFKDVEA
ncbi:MAG: DUF2800 domain-containing protein [Prevotella sp.]|nr:DUF2800 domain-containing protein [Prevotella sp.]